MTVTSAKGITRIGPTRGFIILLALGLVGWGVFVLNPFVNTFASASFYDTLAHLAREEVWGSLFVFAGTVMAYGAVRRKVEIISQGAMLGFMLWSFLSIAYALSNPAITPIVTNGILAVIHGWAWLAVKMEPSVITNRRIWNDDEVTELAELAEIRKQRLIQESWLKNLEKDDENAGPRE